MHNILHLNVTNMFLFALESDSKDLMETFATNALFQYLIDTANNPDFTFP